MHRVELLLHNSQMSLSLLFSISLKCSGCFLMIKGKQESDDDRSHTKQKSCPSRNTFFNIYNCLFYCVKVKFGVTRIQLVVNFFSTESIYHQLSTAFQTELKCCRELHVNFIQALQKKTRLKESILFW